MRKAAVSISPAGSERFLIIFNNRRFKQPETQTKEKKINERGGCAGDEAGRGLSAERRIVLLTISISHRSNRPRWISRMLF